MTESNERLIYLRSSGSFWLYSTLVGILALYFFIFAAWLMNRDWATSTTVNIIVGVLSLWFLWALVMIFEVRRIDKLLLLKAVNLATLALLISLQWRDNIYFCIVTTVLVIVAVILYLKMHKILEK